MKKIYAFIFSLLSCQSVFAGGGYGNEPEMMNSPYLRVFIGGKLPKNTSATVTVNQLSFPSEQLNFASVGPIYGLGLGYSFNCWDDYGIQLEAELSHSKVNIDNVTYGTVVDTTSRTSGYETTAAMANFITSFEFTDIVNAYLGLGLGWAKSYYLYYLNNTQALNPREGNAGNFAYQGIIGFSFRLTSNARLTVDYRYRNLGKTSFTMQTTDNQLTGSFSGLKNQANNVSVGLVVGFND